MFATDQSTHSPSLAKGEPSCPGCAKKDNTRISAGDQSSGGTRGAIGVRAARAEICPHASAFGGRDRALIKGNVPAARKSTPSDPPLIDPTTDPFAAFTTLPPAWR